MSEDASEIDESPKNRRILPRSEDREVYLARIWMHMATGLLPFVARALASRHDPKRRVAVYWFEQLTEGVPTWTTPQGTFLANEQLGRPVVNWHNIGELRALATQNANFNEVPFKELETILTDPTAIVAIPIHTTTHVSCRHDWGYLYAKGSWQRLHISSDRVEREQHRHKLLISVTDDSGERSREELHSSFGDPIHAMDAPEAWWELWNLADEHPAALTTE